MDRASQLVAECAFRFNMLRTSLLFVFGRGIVSSHAPFRVPPIGHRKTVILNPFVILLTSFADGPRRRRRKL